MREQDNVLYNKAFDFAVRTVNLYKYLCNEKREYVLARQVLRSGTSIGANISEGIEGQSKKDFLSKLSISLKEASETRYWIKLLMETNILLEREGNSLLADLREIIKLLNAVIKTTKSNL